MVWGTASAQRPKHRPARHHQTPGEELRHQPGYEVNIEGEKAEGCADLGQAAGLRAPELIARHPTKRLPIPTWRKIRHLPNG